jgi:MSHA pilin protein MshC
MRCRAGRGFTLIELITILLLVGIMSFVALPRVDLLRGFDEIGYRDRVRATIEYARKSAVAQRRHVQVITANNCMGVWAASADPDSGFPGSTSGPVLCTTTVTAFPRSLTLPGAASNIVTPPTGGTLTTASTTLVFDPLGRPLDSAGAVLTANTTFTVSGTVVTVEAETGHVH